MGSATFDVDRVRRRFPGLDCDWTFFDNAGGAQVVDVAVEAVHEHLLHHCVQLGASYDVSRRATARVQAGREAAARLFGVDGTDAVALGPSSTVLADRLARSMMERLIAPGDAVVVTDVDHETNIGPWRRLEAAGVEVRTWSLDRERWALTREGLEPLLADGKVKVVAFTHCSNIVGAVHPVAELTEVIRDAGALSVVDGVAYAPHRPVDVHALGADFYFFSFYKVFAPHLATLWGRPELFRRLAVMNHYFYGDDDLPLKLEPGAMAYELAAGLAPVPEYLDEVGWDAIAAHEEALAERLLAFLRERDGVRVIGPATGDRAARVPTISFVSDRHRSEDVALHVDRHRIGIRFGNFYARRLMDSLGLDPDDGVVRVSMVHYNTLAEVDRLVEALGEIL